MAFLMKRKNAAAILGAVIILFTIFGINRSLNKLSNNIEKMFYNGVYIESENYTTPSISSQLEKREKAALGLVTLGNSFAGLAAETGAVREARISLIDAESITDKYVANEALEKAYVSLSAALEARSDLTDSQTASLSSYVSVMSGAQTVINSNTYNSKVSEYERDVLSSFPVELLNLVIFSDTPEYFGLEG